MPITLKKSQGFTIIELLIVIVIIAILAAITLVAYNGIIARADDSAVQSDLKSNAKLLELYKVDNGSYPNNATQLNAMRTAGQYLLKATTSVYMKGKNNFIYCFGNTSDSYAIAALSSSGNAWYVSSGQTTPATYPGSWTGTLASICPTPLGQSASGAWGYTANTWNTTWLSY
jgi:type II secretion system protein G